MKNHKILAIVLTLATVLALATTSIAASRQKTATLDYMGIKIVLDGVAVDPKDANGKTVEPFAIDGTTYLPIRAIASALGLEVQWDGKTNTVILTTPGSSSGTQTDTTPQTGTSTSNPTASQSNAVKKAKEYLNVKAFSHDGLVGQLEYGGFSRADAVYGADNCG